MGFGAVLGWPSASLLVLESENTPLPTGPLTVVEKSWVSSLMYLGGSLGCLFFGWASKYGRKIPLMGAAFPQLVSKNCVPFFRYNTTTKYIFYTPIKYYVHAVAYCLIFNCCLIDCCTNWFHFKAF